MSNRIKYIRAPGIPKTPIGEEPGDTLPAVSSDDNGDFLRVVNGVWSAETVQVGGPEMFTIHLTGNATNGYQVTESAADIMAHYPNIMLVYEMGFTDEYYLVGARLEEEEMWSYLWFAHDENWITDGTVSRDFVDLSIVWDSENPNYGVSAYRSSTNLRNLPQASNTHNGKILGVVNGDYALVTTNTLFYVDDTTVKSEATSLACTGQDIINATVAKGAVPVIRFTENYIDHFLYLDNTWSAGPTFKSLDGSRELEMSWDSSTAHIINS